MTMIPVDILGLGVSLITLAIVGITTRVRGGRHK